MVMIWWGGQAPFLLEGLWLALRWPCWAQSTSKRTGALNQGDSHPPAHAYTHTLVLLGALRDVFSLLIRNRSLPSKLEIKGCDVRLEDQSERGGEVLSVRH